MYNTNIIGAFIQNPVIQLFDHSLIHSIITFNEWMKQPDMLWSIQRFKRPTFGSQEPKGIFFLLIYINNYKTNLGMITPTGLVLEGKNDVLLR